MVPIRDYVDDIIVDLRYSSNNNMLGKKIAFTTEPMINLACAAGLTAAAATFRQAGYKLVIWDAYRSAETHRALLGHTVDRRYVRLDSNHLSGRAVDITLANAAGEYLDMGTDFDDFTDLAHIDAIGLTKTQLNNRQLLKMCMEAAGFTAWPYEWWHFDYLTR